jgi:hypothetical protein
LPALANAAKPSAFAIAPAIAQRAHHCIYTSAFTLQLHLHLVAFTPVIFHLPCTEFRFAITPALAHSYTLAFTPALDHFNCMG